MLPRFNYDVSLTPEVADAFRERGWGEMLYKGHTFQCESYAEEGSFLHLQVSFPMGTKLQYLDGKPVEKELLDTVRMSLSIPTHFVLYIASHIEEKHPGFLTQTKAIGKDAADAPSR